MKTLVLLLLLLTNLLSLDNYHYINKTYYMTTEAQLKKSYSSVIEPYFFSHKLSYFKSYDGLDIAYKIFKVDNAKANLVISSGRTEGMFKYPELIYDLNKNGYSVYIMDHRGQGYSQRMLKDSQIGHVVDFNDYVKDLHYFVSNFVPKDKKRVLIGHSMGGAIASLYVEEYPSDFTGLVLSSPMHQAKIISTSLSSFSCGLLEKREHDIDRYVIGEVSYDDTDWNFDTNVLTHSKNRFEITKKAFDKEPRTKLGGPSVRWVEQACLAGKRSITNANKIKIPTLLLQAQEDKIVNKEPQLEFCMNAAPYCIAYQIDGAYHELFVEKDSIRQRVLSALLYFISKI